MATIADNIKVMARLVQEVKRETRLTEGTILRIVDMNFALAQQNAGGFNSEMPEPPVEGEFTEVPEEAEGQLTMFPDPEPVEGDEEVLDAVAPEELGGEG